MRAFSPNRVAFALGRRADSVHWFVYVQLCLKSRDIEGKNRGPDNTRLRLEGTKESAALNYNDL